MIGDQNCTDTANAKRDDGSTNLAAQRGDVLGQVGDHPLDPLQLADAPTVLRDQPPGSCSE